MTKRWFSIAGVVGAVALVGVLVAVARTDPSPGASEPETMRWSTYSADVVALRPDGTHRVVITADLPAGAPDCARDLRIKRLQEGEPGQPDMVWAQVVFDSAGSAVRGRCPDHAQADVTLHLAKPVGDRSIMLNSMGPAWTLDGDAYRRCEKYLGCHPPEDPCDPAWIDKVVFTLDVPIKRLRSVRDVLACDGRWLVLDLNREAGNCPPGDAQPQCSPGPGTRLFLKFGQDGWGTVAGGPEAGCVPVRSVPEFPEALCRDLPAPG